MQLDTALRLVLAGLLVWGLPQEVAGMLTAKSRNVFVSPLRPAEIQAVREEGLLQSACGNALYQVNRSHTDSPFQLRSAGVMVLADRHKPQEKMDGSHQWVVPDEKALPVASNTAAEERGPPIKTFPVSNGREAWVSCCARPYQEVGGPGPILALPTDTQAFFQASFTHHDLEVRDHSDDELPFRSQKDRLAEEQGVIEVVSQMGSLQVQEAKESASEPDAEAVCEGRSKTRDAVFCGCGEAITETLFDRVTLCCKGDVDSQCPACRTQLKAVHAPQGILVSMRSRMLGQKALGCIGCEYDPQGRDCIICMEPMSRDDGELSDGLSCSEHHACRTCLQDHFESAIQKHKRPECPGSQCGTAWSDNTILLVCGEQRFLDRVHRFELEDVCAQNPEMFFCPMPDCRYIGVKPDVPVRDRVALPCPQCERELLFYRHSSQASAQLVSADWNQQYQTICHIKRMAEKGKLKFCPAGCKTPIEKSSGCPHMTCGTCGHEFCWVCLKEWKPGLGEYLFAHHRCFDDRSRHNTYHIPPGILQELEAALPEAAYAQPAATQRQETAQEEEAPSQSNQQKGRGIKKIKQRRRRL